MPMSSQRVEDTNRNQPVGGSDSRNEQLSVNLQVGRQFNELRSASISQLPPLELLLVKAELPANPGNPADSKEKVAAGIAEREKSLRQSLGLGVDASEDQVQSKMATAIRDALLKATGLTNDATFNEIFDKFRKDESARRVAADKQSYGLKPDASDADLAAKRAEEADRYKKALGLKPEATQAEVEKAQIANYRQILKSPADAKDEDVVAEAKKKGLVKTVKYDGQSEDDYKKMIKDFPFTDHDKAMKLALAEGRPIVAVIGSFEQNNPRDLIAKTLPLAKHGAAKDAIFIHIDPTNCDNPELKKLTK